MVGAFCVSENGGRYCFCIRLVWRSCRRCRKIPGGIFGRGGLLLRRGLCMSSARGIW
nr:MAG TPA: hypothetical protein [Caudoviricetes sp.]